MLSRRQFLSAAAVALGSLYFGVPMVSASGISLDEAQKNPELRQQYLDYLVDEMVSDGVIERIDVVYDHDGTRLKQFYEHQGSPPSPKPSFVFMVPVLMQEFASGVEMPIFAFNTLFEPESDRVAVGNDDDVRIGLYHEYIHVQQFRYGIKAAGVEFLKEDFDAVVSVDKYLVNLVELVAELQAYSKQLEKIMAGKFQPSYDYLGVVRGGILGTIENLKRPLWTAAKYDDKSIKKLEKIVWYYRNRMANY